MSTAIKAPQPHRPKPDFHLLSLPKGSFSDVTNQEELDWWEGGSETSEDTTEYQLNLGAETPSSDAGSIPVEQWPSNSASSSSYAPKKREWTVLAGNGTPKQRVSIDEWRAKRETIQKERERAGKKVVKDRDCGICFEYAVGPCRTLCCGNIFCREHIANWLEGPSSNGLCPACELPCSFEAGTVPISSSNPSSSTSATRERSGTVTLASYARGREPTSPKGLQVNTTPKSSPPKKKRSPSPSPSPSLSPASTTTSPATTVASTASTIEQWEQIQDADVGVSFSPLKAIGKIKVHIPLPLRPARGEGEELREGGETLEVLSRMASIVGFALVLYALFA